jgi:hypothetical protein
MDKEKIYREINIHFSLTTVFDKDASIVAANQPLPVMEGKYSLFLQEWKSITSLFFAC